MSRRTFSEDIVFVNKTSANFGTRSRREAYQINSHINGSYARWKRNDTAPHLRSKSARLPPGSDEQNTDSRRTAKGTIPVSAHLQPEEPQLDSSSSSEPTTSSNVSVKSPPRYETPATYGQLQFRNPQSVLCRGNSDPFDSTVLPLTALNAHCHSLAREFQVGQIWGEEMSNDDVRAATVNWWMADGTAIHVPTVMHGLLAWAYTSRLSVQSYPPQQITLKALEYKTAALHGLRQLVRVLTSFEHRYAAFECMLFLAATEWTAGNVEALMAHMKSAAAILRTMGGFEVLPQPKKESSLWMFVNLSFHFPVRPLVRPQESDPGSLSTQKELLRQVPELRCSLRKAAFRRMTGTAISMLAGGTLIPLWEALSEAQRALESLRNNQKLSSHNMASVNRWLFLRKLTTRVRLEHLWHDLKLLLDDSMAHEPISDSSLSSQRHLYLWHICMCMATRIFDGLVFDKLHPGEDVTSHWTPYFVRYLLHLNMLEEEEAKCDHPTMQIDPRFQQQCQLAMLWLYFMGAVVEGVVFHRTGGRPASARASIVQSQSCTQRFKGLYAQEKFDQDCDIARTFEEDLLFSPDVMQVLFDEIIQDESPSVQNVPATKAPQ